jgi:ATP-dependent helicase/nuclease subunit A
MPGRRYLGVRLLDQEDYLLRRPFPLRLLLDERRGDDLAEEKRVLYVALTRARDRLILSGTASKSNVPAEAFRRAYAASRAANDELGTAAAQSLLAAKPYPLAWVFYTIADLPGLEERKEGSVGDLPLTVRWIKSTPQAETVPPMNPIREIEKDLSRLRPVEIPEGADPVAERVIGEVQRKRPFPSPGVLEHARGKLWATEFKSGREFPLLPGTRAAEEWTDEPAVPLVPSASEGAAEEGSRIHALLEHLELEGLEATNLDRRLEEAAEKIGGIVPSIHSMLRSSLEELLDLRVGRDLIASPGIEREVAFSLRIPLLEVSRWFPDLHAEIGRSAEWIDWIMPEPSGAFRLRPDPPPEFTEPWVLVQGRIDLVFRRGEGWALLDWKSDRVGEETAIDQRCELYRGQIEIYRRAVARLFGEPVQAGLYFLRPRVYRDL